MLLRGCRRRSHRTQDLGRHKKYRSRSTKTNLLFLFKNLTLAFCSMAPEVSIVIPAFDEQERLGESLRKIHEYLRTDNLNAEVIVVDDGSVDETAAVAEAVLAEYPSVSSQVIRYEDNRGKGYAVRTGLQAAQARIALFSDADLSTPIEE